jgi:hypothetical protein
VLKGRKNKKEFILEFMNEKTVKVIRIVYSQFEELEKKDKKLLQS